MIVVDASALVDILLEEPPNRLLVNRLGSVTEMHVPHLVDVEVLSVVRRLEARGALTSVQAELALKRFGQLPLHRYPHNALSARVWELRQSLTAYDGQYVALAEALELPLVTCDLKLANAHGHVAVVESFAR
jgi:predicted nucleic acid-binding protein